MNPIRGLTQALAQPQRQQRESQIGIMYVVTVDANWKRLGQFTAKKVQLLQRSTGLIVVPSPGLSNLALRLRSGRGLTSIPLRVTSLNPESHEVKR